MIDWAEIFRRAEALRSMPELTSDQAREWVASEIGVNTEEAGRLIYAGLKRQIIFKSPMRTLCGVDSIWRPGEAGMGGAIGSPEGGHRAGKRKLAQYTQRQEKKHSFVSQTFTNEPTTTK